MITKPKGCKDIYGNGAKTWKYIEQVIDSVMEKYNYGYIRTPIFESSELYHRGVGETSDIVTKETYDFTDRGERKMTLRPEGTAGVVRSYIENKMYGDMNPVKLYYNGTMYRYERPQAGRERELTQFGAEAIGSDDPMMDAEIISLAYNIYKLLGLKDITVHINSLGDTESRNNYRDALVRYFSPYINDFCDDCKMRIAKNPLRILDCKVDSENEVFKKAPTTIDYLNEESKSRFEKVKEYLDLLQIPYVVDPKIVRGLDYYNHTVFEFVIDVKELGGQNVIGAGGRYNGLCEQLGGPSTPGIGFASGLDRILVAMKYQEVKVNVKEQIDLFLMYVNDEEKNYALYLAQELRLNGFNVDTEYTSRSLKAQFKQADRLKSKFTAVLNSDDLDNNEIKIKNNETKEEEIISIDALVFYLDEKLTTDEDLYNYDFTSDDECHCHDDECSCFDDCSCDSECHCNHED
ncbi:MAG: histidine--tRNA ligase [bacterium]|nr:histidine--tRNA ligase [bacterium]